MASARQRVNWTAVKADYVSNPMATHNSIAEKYGVTVHSVIWHSRREEWFEARREHSKKVTEKLSERSADNAAEALAAIHRVHLDATRELRQMLQHKLKVRTGDGQVTLRSDVSIADLARVAAAYNQLLESDRIALGADVLPPTDARAPEAEMSDDELYERLRRCWSATQLPRCSDPEPIVLWFVTRCPRLLSYAAVVTYGVPTAVGSLSQHSSQREPVNNP